jgi:phospholipid transport system substrate-binding protein
MVPRGLQGAPFSMVSRRGVLAGCTAALIAGRAVAQGTSPDGAAQFVSSLAQQAIGTLSRAGLTLDQREAVFRDLLGKGFDLEFIARFVAGRYYRDMTPDQQADYQRLFGDYVLKTYASRFGGYTGEQFAVVSARPAGQQDVLVQSRIERQNGPPIGAEWRVRSSGSGYRIIDVTVEGVSMAVTQRAEFDSVLSRGGPESLLAALRARTTKMPATARSG